METLRTGLRTHPPLPVFDLGKPSVDLDKALRLAGEMEDEETLRKMGAGE